jgi:DNA polymerase III psi subunit
MLELLQMNEGTLPVRYLGVPLITKRLSTADCEVLMGKITAQIDSWLSKHLSIVGRLQLISSVLFSLQVFWDSVFILPKKVIKMLEHKLNRFLWCGKDDKAKAKVAWDKVCVPKGKEG